MGCARDRDIPVPSVHVRRMHNDHICKLQPLDQQSAADAAMGDHTTCMANFVLHLPYRIAQIGNAAGDFHFRAERIAESISRRNTYVVGRELKPSMSARQASSPAPSYR